MKNSAKHHKIFGLLGLAASVIVGVGEFLLHFSAAGYGGEPVYGYLQNVSPERVNWGHFLLVAALPLYFAGYWFIYQTLGRSRWALAVLLTGILSFTTGGIWVTSRAMLIEIVQNGGAATTNLLAFYEGHYEILVQVLRVLVLLLSFFWVMAVLKTKTIYPKWMAACNPIVLLALVFLSYLVWPAAGKYLVPTAMNVAHFIFFGLALFHFFTTNKTRA
ncbi:MAG: DUF6796 family protein [Saprospiraceae bacterium]